MVRASWQDILACWPAVVADLARIGVDLTDPATFERPWAPIRDLVLSLPADPASRLSHALRG